ncbi:hypothetical protein [Nocardioides sp. zg-1230]|uniref:hypothetical protein n=1 Tax=Nocardioides sp. zg-1230 TaxID=2736601 RepID=UPI00155813EC|nr:hypothetical protein [Nocardioides sp. zg-1230]NPC44585.1 hypothetical protein [Nocardioides sp. zg-1230]
MTPVYVHEVHTEISGSPAPPVASDKHEPAAVVEAAAARIRREAWLAGRVASEGFDD